MHDGPRSDFNKELRAQGVGNMLCGGVGALPMTGVIVRSSANVQAGAVSRRSTIMHGAWILTFVALLPSVMRAMPMATLRSEEHTSELQSLMRQLYAHLSVEKKTY